MRSVDFRYLTVIAVLVAIILFMRDCNGDLSVKNKAKSELIEMLKHKNAKLISGTHKNPKRVIITDTVEIEKKVYVPKLVTKTVVREVYVDSNEVEWDVQAYTTEVHDSLIDGEIVTKTDGTIFFQELKYTPKFPKYIKTIDKEIIDNRTWGIALGAEIGGNDNMFQASGLIEFQSANGWSAYYRRGFSDKTHNIGLKRLIQFKKK